MTLCGCDRTLRTRPLCLARTCTKFHYDITIFNKLQRRTQKQISGGLSAQILLHVKKG